MPFHSVNKNAARALDMKFLETRIVRESDIARCSAFYAVNRPNAKDTEQKQILDINQEL